jgi:hypothetical protein
MQEDGEAIVLLRGLICYDTDGYEMCSHGRSAHGQTGGRIGLEPEE